MESHAWPKKRREIRDRQAYLDLAKKYNIMDNLLFRDSYLLFYAKYIIMNNIFWILLPFLLLFSSFYVTGTPALDTVIIGESVIEDIILAIINKRPPGRYQRLDLFIQNYQGLKF